MRGRSSYPRPRDSTRFRVIGPRIINGMSMWNVIDVRTGESVGPPWSCFTVAEARGRLDDALVGRKVIYFGRHKFKRKRVDRPLIVKPA